MVKLPPGYEVDCKCGAPLALKVKYNPRTGLPKVQAYACAACGAEYPIRRKKGAK